MSNTSTGLGGKIAATLAIGLAVVAGLAFYSSQDDRGIPVRFTGYWEPGSNPVDFYYLIGVDGDTLHPTGPQYTHEDIAEPEQRLELLITSRPEEPVIIQGCDVQFGQTRVEGTVSGEGATCHVVTSIPVDI